MRCPRLIARSRHHAPATPRALARTLLLALLVLLACAPAGARDIRYGEESCGYCRMTITDRRFGGQVAGARGRVQAFDAVECLADFVNAASTTAAEPPRAWVIDFTRPGTFIPVDSARFVRLARASSPMGAGLAAVAASTPEGSVRTEGPPMTWAELLAARRELQATRTTEPGDGPYAAGAAHAH